jgi:hypothetical protein
LHLQHVLQRTHLSSSLLSIFATAAILKQGCQPRVSTKSAKNQHGAADKS